MKYKDWDLFADGEKICSFSQGRKYVFWDKSRTPTPDDFIEAFVEINIFTGNRVFCVYDREPPKRLSRCVAVDKLRKKHLEVKESILTEIYYTFLEHSAKTVEGSDTDKLLKALSNHYPICRMVCRKYKLMLDRIVFGTAEFDHFPYPPEFLKLYTSDGYVQLTDQETGKALAIPVEMADKLHFNITYA